VDIIHPVEIFNNKVFVFARIYFRFFDDFRLIDD